MLIRRWPNYKKNNNNNNKKIKKNQTYIWSWTVYRNSRSSA